MEDPNKFDDFLAPLKDADQIQVINNAFLTSSIGSAQVLKNEIVNCTPEITINRLQLLFPDLTLIFFPLLVYLPVLNVCQYNLLFSIF